jgi:hypothetical protein
MAYIGNNPDVNAFTVGVERFNGTGACTQFTLTRSISDAKAIEIVVNGVQQDPDNSYTVASGLITFDEAPSLGANNIIVTYRAPVVVTFNQVTSSQLQPNSVTSTALSSDSVINNKISNGAITGNKIAENQITGNLIAVAAISGNQIGTGAISANNFAGGGITSNVLASNLTISVARVSEAININATVVGSNSASGTNVNIDVLNTTVYYFSSNTTGNVTFNLRGNNTTRFDDAVQVGNTVSVVVTLRHNTAAFRSGANVMIDGGLIRTTLANPDSGNIMVYSGNTLPSHSVINALEFNIIGFNIIKKAANSYIVCMSNTLFGLT